MDFRSKRQKVPLWPLSWHGAYQNVSSAEDLPLQDRSTPSTAMSTAYKSLLTPKLTPSPIPTTPGLDTTYTTPQIGQTPLTEELRYGLEKPRSSWFGYGWRGGARIAFTGTVIVLITNIIIMAYMTAGYPHMDGFPVIYRGTCENAEWQNRIWHLAVNVLSTTMLAASNYCMQLLSAPNRSNIDKAHSRGHWLDIGIPSIRNLRFLSWKRQVLWLALCISSVPLHLVYNSTFYAAIATNDYNILYATEGFVTGGGYNTSKFPDSAAQNITFFQEQASSWKHLDNHDCIQQYAHDFITRYRNVVTIVSNVTESADNTLLEVVINELPPGGYINNTYDSFAWICNDTLTTDKTGVTDRSSAGFVPCSSQARALENIANTWWKSGGYHISHCLAEEIKPDCHLHFAPHLMGPVILMNIVKCLVAFYVAYRMVDTPLVTLGDAIQSFIRIPDPTTSGRCLATAHEMERHFFKSAGYTPGPQTFRRQQWRWFRVATKRQWLLLSYLLAIMLAGLIAGLIAGTGKLAPPTIANAWSIGFGQVQTQNLVLGANLPQLGASAVLITALVANAPQAVLSFLYVVYNTIFTLMFLGEDWDLFGAYTGTSQQRLPFASKRETHRYLRVSEPKGPQKSTHFLNLPFRYAIPLIVVSGLLHWLMSQSLYLANISVIPRDGTLPRQDEITTVAFAPKAMIWLCVIALFMVAIVVGNGLRRFGGQMQIVGSNSAAISAACHVDDLSERRRQEMVLRKIAWGEIPSTSGDAVRRHMNSDGFDRNTGLGISKGDRARDTVYSASDFSDNVERDYDVERSGFQECSSLRGQVEVVDIDASGRGKSTGVAHCSFSDAFVFKPEEGKMYA